MILRVFFRKHKSYLVSETPILMKLGYYPVTGCRVFENSFPLLTEVLHKRSAVISVSCNEAQVSETKRAETCWSNYPTCEAKWGYFNEIKVPETKLLLL